MGPSRGRSAGGRPAPRADHWQFAGSPFPDACCIRLLRAGRPWPGPGNGQKGQGNDSGFLIDSNEFSV